MFLCFYSFIIIVAIFERKYFVRYIFNTSLFIYFLSTQLTYSRCTSALRCHFNKPALSNKLILLLLLTRQTLIETF